MSNLRKNWSNKRANEESKQKLMKLMQNGLFIDEIWAKIVVGTSSSVKIQFWPLDHKLRAIWPLDLFITVEIQFCPSDQHECDLGCQITLERGPIFRKKIAKKSAINWRHRHFNGKSPIYHVSPISPIFWLFFAKFQSSDLSSRNVVLPASDTQYIGDILPIFCYIFLLAQNPMKE